MVKKEKKYKKSFWKRLVKLVFLIVMSVFVLIFLISGGVFTAFQFDSLRKPLVNKAVGVANSFLIAKLELEDFRIYSIKNIELKGFRLITGADTLANIPKTQISLKPASFFGDRYKIDRVKLSGAKFKLTRSKYDSVWNYMKIVPPAELKEKIEPSKISYIIRDIILTDTKFIYIDSVNAKSFSENIKRFDPAFFKLSKLNLDLNAKIIPYKNRYEIQIAKLTTNEERTGFNLENFETEVLISEDKFEAASFNIKTGSSDIDIDASMSKVNFFNKPEQEDLKNAEISLDLEAAPLDPKDVEYFADMGIKIGNINGLVIDAEGILNDIKLNELIIEKDRTELKLNGSLRKLLDPKKFNYSADLSGSVIYRNDLVQILPDLRRSIPEFGKLRINKLDIKAGVLKYDSRLDLASDIGSIKGNAAFNLKNNSYDADLQFKEFNPSPFIKKIDDQGNITGSLVAEGAGFTLKKAKGKIELYLDKSYFGEYKLNDLKLVSSIEKGKQIRLDTLRLEVPNEMNSEFYSEEFSKSVSNVFANGYFNYENMKIPHYDINAKIEALNPANLLKNEGMPKYLTAKINANGEGIHPDSLEGKYKIDVSQALFEDRAVMPFSINADIERNSGKQRSLEVNSEFFDLSFSGKFKFTDFINTLAVQSAYLGEFAKSKVNAVMPQSKVAKNDSLPKMEKFPEIDADFSGNIKDVSILAAFMKDMDINTNTNFNFHIYSRNKVSSISIDSINIRSLRYENPQSLIKVHPVNFSGNFVMKLSDSVPEFQRFSIHTDKAEMIEINHNILENPELTVDFNGNRLNYRVGSVINEDMEALSKGSVFIDSMGLMLNIDSLKYSYSDKFTLNNRDDIVINYKDSTLTVNELILYADSTSKIDISGKVIGNTAEDLQFVMNYDELQRLSYLLPRQQREEFKNLSADLTEFYIYVNGDLSSPEINLGTKIENIKYENHNIGKIYGDIIYLKNSFAGSLNVLDLNENDLLNFKIHNLPFDINAAAFDTSKGIDSDLILNEFPLSLASPFLASVDKLRGVADGGLNVRGDLKSPEIKGDINIKRSSFVLVATNMKYFAEGTVKMENDNIIIESIKLENTKRDNEKGKAEVTGKIALQDFMPEHIDISFDAKNFKVLSDASETSMPNIYGSLMITTKPDPIRFHGTLQKPNLEGDVNVLYAELKMPEMTYNEATKTRLRYEIVDKSIRHQIVTVTDTGGTKQKIKSEEEEINFAENLNIDISAKLLGEVSVLMELGALGEIYAKIGTPDRNIPIRYVKKRSEEEASIYGEVLVKEGSTLKSFKVLNAEGNITFPTGQVDNPSLNLTATHKGTTIIDNTPKQYTVTMTITGTKDKPNVKFSYSMDGEQATGDPKKIEEDAIMLLVAGRTKSSSSSPSQNPDVLQQSLSSGISSYGSQLLTEFLMKTGTIQSVDLDLKGESFEEATVKFTGQTELFGGNVSWTIGGSLADLSGNNEIILDVPLASYTNNAFWRNFIIQFTKATHTNTTIQDQDAKNWEIKFKVGGSF